LRNPWGWQAVCSLFMAKDFLEAGPHLREGGKQTKADCSTVGEGYGR